MVIILFIFLHTKVVPGMLLGSYIIIVSELCNIINSVQCQLYCWI